MDPADCVRRACSTPRGRRSPPRRLRSLDPRAAGRDQQAPDLLRPGVDPTPEDVLATLLEAPVLSRYRHYLERKQAWKPHYLGEAEEKVLEEKDVTGRQRFVRAPSRKPSRRSSAPSSTADRLNRLSLQQGPGQALRRRPRESARSGRGQPDRGLARNARLLTFIFNTVVLDHKTKRHAPTLPGPMTSRHLANEIDDATVEAP